MNANIRRLLEDVAVDRASSCIDLGCGNGAVCFWLAERGARVLGVDRALPLPPGVPTAITGVSPGSVVLVNADVLDFDPGGRFETVIAFGLLHSLGSTERVAQEGGVAPPGDKDRLFFSPPEPPRHSRAPPASRTNQTSPPTATQKAQAQHTQAPQRRKQAYQAGQPKTKPFAKPTPRKNCFCMAAAFA